MTFERPHAWALLALAVPIIILFLRFRRRRDVDVPSLAIWHDVAPAGVGRRGLRRIEDAVQLAALLLALVCFTAALAVPVLGAAPDPARRLVVVLDVSASMNARAGSGSRFDEARAAAERAISKLGPGDAAVVWAASAAPRVVVEPTTDHAAARASLARVRPSLERSGMKATLAAAQLAAGRDAGAAVLVLTDAAGAAELREFDGASSFVVGVAGGAGTEVRNAGIVAADVDVNRAVDGDADGGARLRVRVARSDGPPSARTLVLSRAGVEVARADVDVPETGAAEVVLPLDAFAAAGGVAEVRLVPADDFSPDDVVTFALPAPRHLRVALVAARLAPSRFLADALRAMGDALDPAGTVIAQPESPAATFSASDVIVAEDVVPPAAPRDRATLQFGAPGRAVERPIVWSVGAHPVLAGADLSPLRIDRANVLDVAQGERVLIECAEGAVAVAGEDAEGTRHVRIGFRPDATTLPLEAAFPILVRNAVRWLARPPLLPPALRAGAPIATSERLPDVERVWFVGPGDLGPRRGIVRDGSIVETTPLPSPGGSRILTVRGLPGDPATAVNWFAPDGFRLAPTAPATAPSSVEAAAAAVLGDRTGNADHRIRPAGWLAALAALALLGTSRGFGFPGIRGFGDSDARAEPAARGASRATPERSGRHDR